MKQSVTRYTTHHFDAPCGVTFKVVLGRSTYSVAAFDCTGRRIAWSGRNWGPSLTDALSTAAYHGEPLEAASGIWFLFGRIDYYLDRPGLLDLWDAAIYRGEPAAVTHARFEPYREAMAAARRAPYAQRSKLIADAEALTVKLAAESTDWNAERLATARKARVLRYVRSSSVQPIHIDARDTIERQAYAPAGTVDSLIAAGVLRMTRNARGAPAFEAANRESHTKLKQERRRGNDNLHRNL